MKDAADVIVVGAGPAGSVSALLLARAGHDVLLVDRRRFPRAKPCGDSLSAGAGAVLARLGVLDRVEAMPHARLCGWRIVAPDGSAFQARFDGSRARARHRSAAPVGGDSPAVPAALAVERAVLDMALLDAALDAGVRFLPGERVLDLVMRDDAVAGIRLQSGTVLLAPFTIGADGLRSIVARRLGAVRRPPRLRKISLTLHVQGHATEPGMGEMHAGDGVCAGLAAVAPDRFNLTVVADAGRFGRTIADGPHRFIRSTLDSLPGLRGRLDDADLAGATLLASGPFDRPVRTPVFAGAALVGDAAGYYDPFTGQGIFRALAGAELLADSLSTALRHGPPTRRSLAAYEHSHARLLRAPRLVQHGIEAVLSRPRLASRAIRRIGTAPSFAEAILEVTGDLAPATRLLSPLPLLSLINPLRPPEDPS